MKYSKIISTVFILIALFGCFKEDDYDNVDANKILTLTTTTKDSVLADGLAVGNVQVKLNEDASPDRRTVVFKTSLGSFESGSGDSVAVKAGDDFIARATVLSTQAGAAIVSAKTLSVDAKDSVTIQFKKAFPEKIAVSVDSFVLYNNYSSTILITATLSRNDGGKASQGNKVYFFVTNAAGQPVGSFLNNQNTASLGANGKATIRYSAGPGNQPGYLTIRDSASKQDQSPITATTQIYLSN